MQYINNANHFHTHGSSDPFFPRSVCAFSRIIELYERESSISECPKTCMARNGYACGDVNIVSTYFAYVERKSCMGETC